MKAPASNAPPSHSFGRPTPTQADRPRLALPSAWQGWLLVFKWLPPVGERKHGEGRLPHLAQRRLASLVGLSEGDRSSLPPGVESYDQPLTAHGQDRGLPMLCRLAELPPADYLVGGIAVELPGLGARDEGVPLAGAEL